MAESGVDVVVQIAGENVLAGRLWAHRRRGAESATFSYDDGYLTRPGAYELDPALSLVAGAQQTAGEQAIFGAFSDCAPDRWGRRLIARTERQRVRREGGTERSFGESDYLLGVRDDLRQGALRFRDPQGGAYLADEATGVPSLLDLPNLLGAADRLEREETNQDDLRILLHGGSSLGGSRPKAHVLDASGKLAIAKFPSPSDEQDAMRWESVALGLARASGIGVPDWAVHTIDGKAVLAVERFDRSGDMRIAYVSAMTMLEAKDGDLASYLEIADVIERHSPTASEDLCELWRRIAFSVLIRNTDDHLRNHGFLRTNSAGWTLSPAFDLNPDASPGPTYLSTAIDFEDTTASVDLLMSVAPSFRLDAGDARGVLAQVSDATGRWRAVAREAGLSRAEVERMAPAFEHAQAERARNIVA